MRAYKYVDIAMRLVSCDAGALSWCVTRKIYRVDLSQICVCIIYIGSCRLLQKIYTNVYIHIYIYAHTCVYINVYMYIYKYIHDSTRIFTHASLHTHASWRQNTHTWNGEFRYTRLELRCLDDEYCVALDTHMSPRMHMCVCACIYTHTRTHTRTHTHTHTMTHS